MTTLPLHLTVNGEVYDAFVSENATLLTLLRDVLGLTGTKEGCGAGECGACTVIMNGLPLNSCMVLALECEGAEIRTIESEYQNGQLSNLQQAFIEHNAFQCGFCTPGMIMSARALLEANPNPSRDDIKEAMEGNLCRCTGYDSIIAAIESVGVSAP
ncbi:MAG: (2Fe-2S)-binding protein [Coriobacteriales bacterium]|jgi:carbon-monoxide dehydrogenase small subunit|nr:(2Fe-2S)-binding protein [Coriobacteriales bacterium]